MSETDRCRREWKQKLTKSKKNDKVQFDTYMGL